VILLALQPPTMAAPAEPPPPARPRVALPRGELEMLAAVTGAPGAEGDSRLVAGGGALRGLARWSHVGVGLGIEGLSPTTIRFGAIGAHFDRVPLDLSARGLLSLARVDLFGDLGFALTLVHVTGVDLGAVQSGTRAEPGLRAGVGLRVWVHPRLALSVGLHGVVSFAPSEIAVDPLGVIGRTPFAWLAGTVGLAVRLH
jgi:hypothetical protein